MTKSIIIIGAGVSGLAAGCYGQMNNYKTQIFEMDIKPGGLCTAWERKGYLIDGCLHWLVGTKPNTPFYKHWQELGVLQGKTILNMDEFYRIEGQDGKVFHLYTNLDQLEKHMKELAPEDAKVTEEFIKAVRTFSAFEMPIDKPQELYNPLDYAKIMFRMGSTMGEYRKLSKISINDYALRFQNPLIRQAFLLFWPPQMSVVFFFITLAELHDKMAGYIIGGSRALALSMEKRYFELGGKVNYHCGVEKILVENNRAVGVKLVNGTEHKADYVISAADLHSTVFNLLEGKYVDDKIPTYFENRPYFSPIIYIGLGVNRSFSDEAKIISGMLVPLDKPLMIAGKENKWLSVRIHNFDPTLAPEGKTLLTVTAESDFAYWENLRQDKVAYTIEKEKITAAVVTALNKHFPGLTGQLEMWDMATPYTFYRYTATWKGGYEGWLPTPETANMQIKMKLPGLDGFYMINQWIQSSGGLPTGAMSGSHVIQLICKQDKKKFGTSRPKETSDS
jgi:phytoene dehydrogenase-like protein